MKLKNIMALLMVMLALGVLFAGCAKEDTGENTIGTGDDENTGNADNMPDEVNDDSVNELLTEDSVDEDVEIGSLI